MLKKPTDLDLHFLQKQGISGFSRTRVNIEQQVKYYHNHNISYRLGAEAGGYPEAIQEKMPYGIMDRFFKKVNQKVNLEHSLTHACPHTHPLVQRLLF